MYEIQWFKIESNIFSNRKIQLILKLEDNAIPSEIGRKFVHPLHTNWFKGNVPGLYHEIRVPYTDKKLENLV